MWSFLGLSDLHNYFEIHLCVVCISKFSSVFLSIIITLYR